MLHALLQAAVVPLTTAIVGTGTAIPQEELDTLVVAAAAAAYLAHEGNAADGYTCLLAARRRAEALLRGGEPWAAELVERCVQAADTYADRCRIARE